MSSLIVSGIKRKIGNLIIKKKLQCKIASLENIQCVAQYFQSLRKYITETEYSIWFTSKNNFKNLCYLKIGSL